MLAGPPVEDFQPGPFGVRIDHQHLLRRQGTVVEATLVRVLQRLRQLAQQVQARRQVQVAGVAAFEEVVQAFGVRVVLEDEGGSLLRAGEGLDAENAVVGDAVEQLVLPLCRAPTFGTHGFG